MSAECGDRTDHGAEVSRVGDVVEGHQQGRLAAVDGQLHQIFGMGVAVRRYLQGDALVHAVRAHPVEFGPLHLEDRDALVAGDLDGFGDALIGIAPQHDVQSSRRDAGAQAFDHRVTSENVFGPIDVGLALRTPSAGC